MNETTELIMKQLNQKKTHAVTHELGGGDEIDATLLKNYLNDGTVTAEKLDPYLIGSVDNVAIQQEFDKRGINVQKYGAVGDGVTDDSVAIQAAVDAAGNNETVLLPIPTVGYKITVPIILRQGQKIEGSFSTILDYTSDYCFKLVGGSTFATDAKTHASIKGLNIVGSSTSLGAIFLRNVYLIELEKVKISGYTNASAKSLYIEDFFQIDVRTVQINAISNGTGLYVNAVTGNSGQLNLYNTIIQRCQYALDIIGTSNLIDGVAMYGGAIGNNYNTGVRIGKNAYNVSFYNSHLENHDGVLYSGTKAVDMVLGSGLECEGIGFYNCLFINNKYAIQSDNAKRVVLLGNEFDGRSISGNVAITQGSGDSGWLVGSQKFTGYSTNITESGTTHVFLNSLYINSSGVIKPQNVGPGIYSGAGAPEGVVTAPQGSVFMRNNGASGNSFYSKYTGSGNTGWIAIGQVNTAFTTAGRPSATSVPAGSQIYDTDLSIPLWTNGATWRKSDGTAG